MLGRRNKRAGFLAVGEADVSCRRGWRKGYREQSPGTSEGKKKGKAKVEAIVSPFTVHSCFLWFRCIFIDYKYGIYYATISQLAVGSFVL